MKSSRIFIWVILFSLSYNLFAVESVISCDSKTFSCYKENLEKYCNASTNEWKKGPDFGKITEDYADFTSKAQNEKMKSLIENEKNAESKAYLEKMLSSTRIGGFEGYRVVEIARVEYRNNMNRIFSCAVAAGRADQLTKLEEVINKKFPGKWSDIKEKLKKEKERYKNIITGMNCNQNTDGSTNVKIVDKLARSATIEYCSYQYYLDYLDANIKQDFNETLQKEKQIGENNTYTIPKNTDAFLQKLTKSIWSIEDELSRAKSILPKAVVAYREMERTYTLHILLVIIYDDYLNLRDNLKSYMNALSQTFEKANNAQDANQR